MISTVLTPTDGSDHANKAVTFASDIASKYGARVIFLHIPLKHSSVQAIRKIIDVQHLSAEHREELDRFEEMQNKADSVDSAYHTTIGLPDSTLEAVGNEILDQAIAEAKNHGVKETSRALVHGDPGHAIIDAVKKEKVDLIVMGSRGLSDLKGLLVGSVSHKVSHLATCTCITVK